jgi:uncharacterized membrane protein required for colicin V production
MNLVDLGIVLVIGFGILIGWRNGLIGPLLAQATFLLSFVVIASHPNIVGLIPPEIPRPLATLILPIALGLVVGIVGRTLLGTIFQLPLTRQLDKLLGAAANGALALVIVYLVLFGLASAGTVLDPLLQATTLRSGQVAAMRTLLQHNPQASSFVPVGELGQLATVSSAQPIPLAQLGQYAKVIEYYQRDVRPQLASSRLAPLVLRVGSQLPVIGHRATLPTR